MSMLCSPFSRRLPGTKCWLLQSRISAHVDETPISFPEQLLLCRLSLSQQCWLFHFLVIMLIYWTFVYYGPQESFYCSRRFHCWQPRGAITVLGYFCQESQNRTIRCGQQFISANWPDQIGDGVHTVDLTLTSVPSIYSDISILPPLDSLDHCYYITRQLHPLQPSTFLKTHFGATIQATGRFLRPSFLFLG